MQKQYVEKPTKVLAEQFVAGATPPPTGVCSCTLTSPFALTGGPPHAHIGYTVVMLQDTDWLLAKPHHDPAVIVEVLSAVEFEDRFGSTGPPAA